MGVGTRDEIGPPADQYKNLSVGSPVKFCVPLLYLRAYTYRYLHIGQTTLNRSDFTL